MTRYLVLWGLPGSTYILILEREENSSIVASYIEIQESLTKT